jgi:tetratricopeptide (TPR) repeat protein
MKRLTLYILLVSLIIVSCGRKIAPSASIKNDDPGYDIAAFNYVYVEALKQKLLGNAGEALKYFEQCVKINPKSDATWFQMAQIVGSSGDTRHAKAYARKALAIDEKNLWYLMLMSGLYYQDKNVDSAIVWYEKAVKFFPANEEIQLSLGNLYIENKNYDKANSIFDAFDRKYGINEESTVLSVKSLIASGKFNEAESKMAGLIKEKPDDIIYLAPYILSHRIILKGQGRFRGLEPMNIIKELVASIKPPVENLER